MSQQVVIERMGYGADAIGHMPDGKTVFVDGGVPGDTLEVDITLEKPSFCKARMVSVTEPSPYRVDRLPVDAVASGATWAHLDYACQLSSKTDNVKEALVRTGKMDRAKVEAVLQETVPSEKQWGYRNKIELSAFQENGSFCLGSHLAASDVEIALKNAPLGNRLIEKAPKSLTGVLRYLQGKDSLGIYRVGVRASVETDSIEVALWTPPSAFPRNFAAKSIKDAIGATSVVRILAHSGKSREVKKVEVLDGDGFWREVMSEEIDLCDGASPAKTISSEFRISAPSFFQVNTAQAQNLVELAVAGLELERGMDVVDVYCGAGTFSIPLAKLGCNVSAIEIAGSSTKDLVRNAQINNVDIEVICDDAKRALPDVAHADAMVVDPPRSGLDPQVIDLIASIGPKRVAYISCDPQTFARDVKLFDGYGYALRRATPVDMFPQTYHVELVGIFSRSIDCCD